MDGPHSLPIEAIRRRDGPEGAWWLDHQDIQEDYPQMWEIWIGTAGAEAVLSGVVADLMPGLGAGLPGTQRVFPLDGTLPGSDGSQIGVPNFVILGIR
jgi:hypothetical protein